jgi:uncharacterized protein
MKQVDARKTLEAFFREAGGRDCSVTFFGGEPLLNFPVIRDAVHYSKQLAARHNTKVGFTMTTNLTLLTDEIADFLAENAFHVMVSLDGSKEQNDRYRVFRGGGGTYETVERNLGTLIAKMKEAGVRLPKVRATMTTENSDPIAIEQHIKSLGTHLVEIGETHGTAGGGKAAYDVGASSGAPSAARRRSASLIESAIQALERDPQSTPDFPVHIVKSLQRIQETVTSKAHKHSEPKLCGVCRNMKAVTPGGDLYPCHRYVGMPEFKIGNIHEGGVDKQKAKQYYEGIYNAFALKCSKCWARHLCGGQCPWYLSRPDGTIVTPDDSTCDTIRESFETYLGLYSLLLESFPAAFQRVLEVDPKTIRGQELGQAPDLQCGT